MKLGIYHVKFTSAQQSYGEGLAVFKDTSINGGDTGYVYLGSFSIDATNVSAKIKVKRWNHGAVSIFGPLQDFDLDLKGTVAPDAASFSVTGSVVQMPGMKITINGRRVSDAA